MKKGCRVTIYIEGQRDPVTGTVEKDEPLLLYLRELDEPVEKSSIVTCTEIDAEDQVADDESEPSEVVRSFSVHESDGVEPVAKDYEMPGSSRRFARILILVSTVLAVVLFFVLTAIFF